MTLTVNAASACLPGRTWKQVVATLISGVHEPAWGQLQINHLQLCPQHPGDLTEVIADELMAMAPDTQLRLHANVYVGQRKLYDASTLSTSEHQKYFKGLASMSKRIKATAYSLHAGYRHQSTLQEMRDNVLTLQDWFGVPVAVEALYPIRPSGRTPKPAQLLDSWAELEWLMEQSGLYMAIDLSHLQIIAAHEGRNDALVASLLAHPNLLEVHVSDNDSRHDEHAMCSEQSAAWWMPLLQQASLNKHCVVFSEGNQAKPHTKALRRQLS